MHMAEKWVWAQRSYRVAMRHQSFRRPQGVLDAKALAMQGLVVFDHGLAVLARRDAGGDAPGGQRRTETVTVVAPICQ